MEDKTIDKSKRFSQEIKERAVRLVLENQREYPSQWSAISSVAEKIGCSSEFLRWVRRREIDLGKRNGVTSGKSWWPIMSTEQNLLN